MKYRPSPRAILIAACAIAVLYAYPGYLTRGGDDQLVDSRVGAFTDWAPALMTALWHALGWLWSGPAPMLLVQIVLLAAGAYHLLGETYRSRAAAAWAASVLVMPPVLATIAVIVPESQLAAVGIAAAAAFGARSWVRWLALPMVSYAASLGSGAALAMLPIVLVRCDVVRLPRAWLRYPVALAIWAVLVLAGIDIGGALVDQPSHRDDNALAIDDITAILHDTGPTDDAGARLALAAAPPDADALARARRTLVAEHPGAYLSHRVHVGSRVLGFHRGRAWLPMYSSFLGASTDGPALQHAARHSPVQRALLAAVHAVSRTALFHPYVYAILALLLLPIAIAWRARDAAMLLASGIAGELAMLVTTNAPELRYSLWLIVTTLLAIALLVATRIARGSRALPGRSPARAPGP